MRRAFWEDPYRFRLETTVSAVDGNAVTLAETIFYAFAGGQESDSGDIAGRHVLEAIDGGERIEYVLGDGHGLRPGDPVVVAIDPERRLRLMRLHSAAELVLQLMYSATGGARKTGAHISADKARLDFQIPGSVSPLLPDIAARVEEVVAADVPIECGYSDEARERRFWRATGFDPVPCCGTHPRRSGEIGAVRLRRDHPGRGVERVEIYLL